MMRNERGFEIYTEFTDYCNNKIAVVESSLATERACWIDVTPPTTDPASAHLTVDQAIQLREALGDFINDKMVSL